MTGGQKRYQEYLKSDHWKDLNERKRSIANKRCAICGFTGSTDNHHLTYRDWYSVSTSDLRLLCRRCHRVTHELINSGQLRFKSDSHHSRFALTKIAVAKYVGVNMRLHNFGDPEIWKHSEVTAGYMPEKLAKQLSLGL